MIHFNALFLKYWNFKWNSYAVKLAPKEVWPYVSMSNVSLQVFSFFNPFRQITVLKVAVFLDSNYNWFSLLSPGSQTGLPFHYIFPFQPSVLLRPVSNKWHLFPAYDTFHQQGSCQSGFLKQFLFFSPPSKKCVNLVFFHPEPLVRVLPSRLSRFYSFTLILYNKKNATA